MLSEQAQHGLDRLKKPRTGSGGDRLVRPRSVEEVRSRKAACPIFLVGILLGVSIVAHL